MKRPPALPTTVPAALALLCALGLSACTHPAAPTAPAASTLEIYKSDGARQCAAGSGISPDDMQGRDLAGIAVLARRKDELRDVAFPAVCGGATGSVNVYVIDSAHWPQARARGFALWQPAPQP